MFEFLICSIGASSDSLVLETNKGELATTSEDVVEVEVGDEEVAGLAELSFKCTIRLCLSTLALVANFLPQKLKVHVKTTGETCRATCRL